MLFYRDGISESQFKDCIKHEISTIENAYRELSGQELQLTLIICGKRHNTRFYATEKDQTYPVSSKDTDKDAKLNGNLKPGLLVTKVVTNAVPENFFLQSHRAIKGTARSAHYHILRDDLRLGLKRASELTMMLCYVFSRATTGVSYVAPAYNADRLCERGRVYLRNWIIDPDMDPKFEMPTEKDKNGKRVRVSQEKIDEAKKAFAETISKNQDIWGKNYGTQSEFAKGATWRDPWHPELNKRDGMFWM